MYKLYYIPLPECSPLPGPCVDDILVNVDVDVKVVDSDMLFVVPVYVTFFLGAGVMVDMMKADKEDSPDTDVIGVVGKVETSDELDCDEPGVVIDVETEAGVVDGMVVVEL